MPELVDGHRHASVAIVGTQRVVQAGLDALLRSADPDVVITGGFDGVADFSSAHPTAVPECVVVVDVRCGARGADLDVLRHISAAGHRAVAYTCRADDDVAATIWAAGALGVVASDEPQEALLAAVTAARRGGCRSPAPTRRSAMPGDAVRTARPQLSMREREVLVAWFRTDNKHAVADVLYIEPTTVATHLQRVRAKYAAVGRPAPTKAALVARAIQDGILSVDDL